MNQISFSLLGKLSGCCDGAEIPGLELHRVQELLCYLLIYRRRNHNREQLASVLWGETSTAQSKKNLRQTIWQLQTALHQERQPVLARLLMVDNEWIQVNPDASYWLDIAVLEDAFLAVQAVPDSHLTAEQKRLLEESAGLYRGDLLEGWYQEWCIFERERYRSMYLAILDKLIGYSEAHGEYEAGLLFGAQVLRFDRAMERAHRRLMRLHYLAGNRTAALRQYELCLQALREELDVEPAQSTQQLYRQICADEHDQIAGTPLPPASPPPTPPATGTSPAIQQLLQLRVTLAALQQQLDQCVKALEQTLTSRH